MEFSPSYKSVRCALSKDGCNNISHFTFYNVIKRWCLCPFPLECGRACELYPKEEAKVIPQKSQGQFRKGIQCLPCLLYHSHYTKPAMLGGNHGTLRGHTQAPQQVDSVFKSSSPSKTVFRLFQPPAVESPPDLKSSLLRCET